jgi:hypothetical protein
MAGRTKREIRDQDVQGLKCLRKIRPLLSRLRKVGTERDRDAGVTSDELVDLGSCSPATTTAWRSRRIAA